MSSLSAIDHVLDTVKAALGTSLALWAHSIALAAIRRAKAKALSVARSKMPHGTLQIRSAAEAQALYLGEDHDGLVR